MFTSLPSRKLFPAALALLVLVVMLGVSEYLYHFTFQHQKQLLKSKVFNEAATLRLNIEREINTTLNLATGLILFVSSNPSFSNDQFILVARRLLQQAPQLRNVALARDNVITHVHPLSGNEKALGLKYMDVPEQWEAVELAITSRNTVIAGPVNLKQGGQGFISRIPIFLAESPDSYWGLASIVINVDAFYDLCGLLASDGAIQYGLRGKDGRGRDGEVFFGEEALFSDPEAVQLPIKLPIGSWLLAAKPAAPLSPLSSPVLLFLRIFGLVVATAVSVMVYALFTSYRRIHFLALHDPLTGLANRRLFFEHVRQAITAATRKNGRFAIVYIDLDNFKPVNDTHGHKHGDHVLREVANRLSSGLRHSDITARIGGDEFILLLQDATKSDSLPTLVDKISQLVCRPLTLSNGKTIEVEASIGAALFPLDGRDSDQLIRQADRRMYSDKNSKRG